jgi:hypothetical protein
VSLEGVDVSTTNAIKLRLADVETVIVPERVIADDVPFVLALTAGDVKALSELAQRGVSLQRLMEQAVSTSLEPFNLISKRRNRLTGLVFSHNVVGFTASSLEGEVSYTQATARFKLRSQTEFAMRLLVSPKGRDRIESRANVSHTQRALFSIIEGAYVCSPQWEPPPPPPLPELPSGLPERLTASWMQSFFVLNTGALAARVFGQPVAFQSELDTTESLEKLASGGAPVIVVRLIANDKRELEALVLVTPEVERELVRLSKSAEARFVGELFRVLFGEAAAQWQKLAGQDVNWKAQAVGRIGAGDFKTVTSRLEGGGVVLRQEAGLDEGTVQWHIALPPHTWHWMMRMTAKSMDFKAGEQPERDAIFQATGWGAGSIPWKLIFPFFGDRDLQLLVRQLDRLRMTDADLAAVGRALTHGNRDRWLEAMPQNLRERVQDYKITPGEALRRQIAMTQVLIGLNLQNRLPEGRLVPWLAIYSEFQWQRRQRPLEALLPLRHLVYGMDRGSLSRLLYDEKNQVLEEALCWAEFAVLDQVRRAISPGFALRLLDNIAHRRPRTNAYTAQAALLTLYRRAHSGMVEGRYMIRRTPARRLTDLIRALDEPQ